MNDDYLKKVLTTAIFIGLLVLTFIIIKPIIIAIIGGLILGFIFIPVYEWIYKRIKIKDLSASIVLILLLIIIVFPLWFLIPMLVRQSLEVFKIVQGINFIEIVQGFFPTFSSEELAAQIGPTINSLVSDLTSYLMNTIGNILLDFPSILLQTFVVLFVFYYTMRDRTTLVNYIKSLLPFSQDIQKKLFSSTREITSSVLYGQVIIGIIQGIIIAIGFIIFGVPNGLFLSLLAVLAGIFPIIGTAIIWIPVAIILFINDMTFTAVGVSIFGVISSTIDNLLRPMIVSRRTQLKSSIALTGMIGGLFVFNIMGLILGPLILAYLLIILEIYRKKPTYPGFIKQHS